MAKDGTNRGDRRVRAGAKPDALNEKLAKGLPATRLEYPTIDPFNFWQNLIPTVLCDRFNKSVSSRRSDGWKESTGCSLGSTVMYRLD